MKETLLQLRDVSVNYGGVRAVDGVSLSFEAGKITSLIGPNGSGKTTLMHVLTGLVPWDAGAVFVQGTELRKLLPYEAPSYGLTRTFQDIRLFEQMTVLDNLLVVLTERPVFRALIERHTAFHLKRAESLLQKVGLWDKRLALACNLSYGQRKLLEMARALAMDPRIVLFDELFAGLFPEMVKQMKSIVLDLKTEGRTVIVIEHDMALIREISDHVYVLDSGRLLASGSAEEVLKDPKVVAAYLGV